LTGQVTFVVQLCICKESPVHNDPPCDGVEVLQALYCIENKNIQYKIKDFYLV